MAKRLILAGAGHAHLYSIMNIPDFIRAGYSVTWRICVFKNAVWIQANVFREKVRARIEF